MWNYNIMVACCNGCWISYRQNVKRLSWNNGLHRGGHSKRIEMEPDWAGRSIAYLNRYFDA